MNNHPKLPNRIVLNRIVLILISAILFFVYQAKAQPFQIVWGMNRTLAGISSSTNFTPANAALYGAHPHGLPTVLYYSIGTGNWAYGTTYWHTTGIPKYLEFSFSVNTYEYDLNSVTFRVRRSPEGPTDVVLKSSLDGFSSSLTTKHLTTDGLFYNVTASMGLSDLATGVTFRLYAYNAANYLGVIYFDQIVINGEITTFVLPVSLTDFSARLEDKIANLAWETAWEQNSKEFMIERSSNMVEFRSIGTVSAGGSTTGRTPYYFTDKSPPNGASYYRLKMIDIDGGYNYSGIRDILLHSNSQSVTVSPNPASADVIRFESNGADHESVTLTNISGQDIPFNIVTSEIGYINLYPQKMLSPGLYVLSILQNGRKVHVKVLVP